MFSAVFFTNAKFRSKSVGFVIHLALKKSPPESHLVTLFVAPNPTNQSLCFVS